MADEEAEQERLSRGGCVAELQRLGERLQELERELRESRAPAVEAATEYCQQLCQVSAPAVPSPFPPLEGEEGGRASAEGPSGGRPCPGVAGAAARRQRGGRGRSLCVAAVVAAAVGSSRLGEGSCGRGGKSPRPFPFPNSGCAVREAEGMPTARKGALSAAGRREGATGGPAAFSHLLSLCPGITAPPATARLLRSAGPPPPRG